MFRVINCRNVLGWTGDIWVNTCRKRGKQPSWYLTEEISRLRKQLKQRPCGRCMPGGLRNQRKAGGAGTTKRQLLGQDVRGEIYWVLQDIVRTYTQCNESHYRVLCGGVARFNVCFKRSTQVAVLRIGSGSQGLKQVEWLWGGVCEKENKSRTKSHLKEWNNWEESKL